MRTIQLLVGSGRPVWLEIDRGVPVEVISGALAEVGMSATADEVELIARIGAATKKEAAALARAHNDRKLVEWPSMALTFEFYKQ